MRFTHKTPFLKQLHTNAGQRLFAVAVADDYDRRAMMDQILTIFGVPERIARFNGADLEFKALRDTLETASLFGGETIAVIDQVEKIPKAILTDLQKMLPITFGHLILGIGGKSPLISLVDKEGLLFDLLDEKVWDKEKRLLELMEAKVRKANVTISSDVMAFFLERQEKEVAILEQEMDKLLCYIGEKKQIERNDILAITTSSRSSTLWHVAEEIVWERKLSEPLEESSFHSLMAGVRAQLQLGLKIASLLEQGASRDEWSEALPRVFAKTLEKRTSQAAKLGSFYFSSGLMALFDIELRSRSGSSELLALFDLFRTKLASLCPKGN